MTDVTATMQKERDRLMKRLREQSRRVSVAAETRLEKEDPNGLRARYAERLQQVTAEKDAAIARYDAEIREYAQRIAELEEKLAEIRTESQTATEAAGDVYPGEGKSESRAKAPTKRRTPAG